MRWLNNRRRRAGDKPSARSLCALLGLLVGITTSTTAGAVTVNAFDIARSGDTFRLHSDITLRAPLERVRAVLSQYERIPRIDPDITEVTMMGVNANGSVRMRLASSHCFLFACLRYRWTQDVRTLPSGDIVAEIVPVPGEAQSGWVRYRTVRAGEHTRLVVDAEIDASGLPLPGALIGPWMQRRLDDEARETGYLVEGAANGARTVALSDT